MKATIENFVYYMTDEIALEFADIINAISLSDTEAQLRIILNVTPKYFMIGFGGHHAWVKQIINGEPRQQVIFVEFPQE
jgi:hypothetical protein